jgi:hypothetical protein
MKINGMNLWINGDKNGGPAQYIHQSCSPNCELVQWGVVGLPCMVEYKEWDGVHL